VRALLEAAQSRLTDIHGAREDVAPADREMALGFAAVCAETRPRRLASDMPDYAADAASPERGVRRVLKQMRGAGFTQVAAVSLDAPVPGLHVKRVVVPGMRISELL
jgi:ribosomal protein S12 methylthiotransferase accessory factor